MYLRSYALICRNLEVLIHLVAVSKSIEISTIEKGSIVNLNMEYDTTYSSLPTYILRELDNEISCSKKYFWNYLPSMLRAWVVFCLSLDRDGGRRPLTPIIPNFTTLLAHHSDNLEGLIMDNSHFFSFHYHYVTTMGYYNSLLLGVTGPLTNSIISCV